MKYPASLELAMNDFGGFLQIDSAVVSQGTTAALILSNDPERVFVLLVNLSANDVYIGFNPQVSSSNGIFIGANGGSISFNAKDDYTLTGLAIYAVAGAAASNIFRLTNRRDSTIQEGT